MTETIIRSERHRSAVTEYEAALAAHRGLTGMFRASIPTLTKAQVRINRARNEITAAVEEAKANG